MAEFVSDSTNSVLPKHVVSLVIAAREAFDTGMLPDEEQTALDKALERFAEAVPYENEPARAAPPAMDHSEIVSTLRQYINDLRYPPSADSAERRIAAAERVIAKVVSASQECGQ